MVCLTILQINLDKEDKLLTGLMSLIHSWNFILKLIDWSLGIRRLIDPIWNQEPKHSINIWCRTFLVPNS